MRPLVLLAIFSSVLVVAHAQGTNPCLFLRCASNQVCQVRQSRCSYPPCPAVAVCVATTTTSVTRPGTCPASSGFSTCVFIPGYNCVGDSQCASGEKCCPNGCGSVCKKVQTTSTAPSCASVLCPTGSQCALQAVQCIRAPCPTRPVCVAITPTAGSDPCSTMRCSSGQECRLRMTSLQDTTIIGACTPVTPTSVTCPQGKPVTVTFGDFYYDLPCGSSTPGCPRGTRCVTSSRNSQGSCCLDSQQGRSSDTKPGSCPPGLSQRNLLIIINIICSPSCSGDSSCPGAQKCCGGDAICGPTCYNPVFY